MKKMHTESFNSVTIYQKKSFILIYIYVFFFYHIPLGKVSNNFEPIYTYNNQACNHRCKSF